jgi:glyoxylase-like metal-dependent hydrolase (beta-lactamase superfamily II)/ferredoxin
MARPARRLPTNASGPLFVDDSCIDCGTCWGIAPTVFDERDEHAAVVRQPVEPAERERAFRALVSCPTSSIGTEERGVAADLRAASRAFPEPVAGDVFYCGYAAPGSFGASSWLIVRPGRGNVLVDSPRAAAPLLDGIEALGGVALMLLTHQDDVADHRRFRERFGCERVMHEADVGHDTADVERKLSGREPIALDDDLLVVPVPGHTEGSLALLHGAFLFTGDHLWGEGDHLGASRGVCWWSWPEQTRSMERLLDLRFEWVLPGHGGRFHAPADAMRGEVQRLVERMRAPG